MKITEAFIGKLLDLAKGKQLPASQLRGDKFREMQDDGVLVVISRGSHKTIRAIDEGALRRYVAGKYDIRSLEETLELFTLEDASRFNQVDVTGNSKFLSRRTFRGFLVNCYRPIATMLNGRPFLLSPPEGTYVFIYDYELFSIPSDVVVVGVENAENFRCISSQRALIESCVSADADILFVCRYPQNGDLVRWLQSINNRYIHFGDLDLAGINIYQSEYYSYLGDRASLLIPSDYEGRVQQGSLGRYNSQYQRFRNMKVTDHRVQPLVDCINKYHRGYDQEGYL